jgi:hypothetical protein
MFKFYFSFIFLTMVYSIEQNTFIAFEIKGLLMVNGHIHYLIIKINSGQNIQTTFKVVLCLLTLSEL